MRTLLPVDYAYTADMLNRQSVTDNGAVTAYASPNGMNETTQVGGTSLEYDSNFNLTSFGGATATYDAQNHLVSATRNSSIVSFVYDGLGRCVKRTINGVVTLIAYDGWKPTVEWDGGGSLTAYNVYGNGPAV
jgi:YD repeat-containing protein